MDIPLSSSSQQLLGQITLDARWRDAHWVSSPMVRARQTAEALGVKEFQMAEDLREMDWGEFEGMTLPAIEKEIPARRIQPDTGLHFRPPGGESPAEVSSRLKNWLSLPKTKTTIAVTHKGVIRAAISIATGWDMEKPYSVNDHAALNEKIDWLLPLEFALTARGKLTLRQINVALESS